QYTFFRCHMFFDFFSSMTPRPPSSTLFPYTTLFRSNLVDAEIMLGSVLARGMEITSSADDADVLVVNTCAFIDSAKEESIEAIRSEEHTSELQSLAYLVCRLLLEKKK